LDYTTGKHGHADALDVVRHRKNCTNGIAANAFFVTLYVQKDTSGTDAFAAYAKVIETKNISGWMVYVSVAIE